MSTIESRRQAATTATRGARRDEVVADDLAGRDRARVRSISVLMRAPARAVVGVLR